MHTPSVCSSLPRWSGLTGLVSVLLAAACAEDPSRSDRPSQIEITSPVQRLDIGQTVTLSVTVRDGLGKELRASRVSWTSSDRAVAEVTDGHVIGRSAGEVYIRAAAGPVADSVLLTVETPVAQMQVAPDTVFLIRGRVGRLFVDMKDAGGNPIQHSLAFSTSSSGVATVSEGGEVQGVSVGSATLTVAAGAKSVDVPVRVVTGERYSVRYLGTLGGDLGRALGLNNRGEVVGTAALRSGAERAFLWRGGMMIDLGTVAGFEHSLAAAINDRGTIVGSAENRPGYTGYDPPLQTTPWVREGGTMAPIQVSFSTARAVDVNNRGQIAISGLMSTVGAGSKTTAQSWVWNNGQLTELKVPGSSYTVAEAITDQGTAGMTAVWYEESGVRRQGYTWDGTRYAALAEGFTAKDLNDRGVVVGYVGGQPFGIGAVWSGSGLTEIRSSSAILAVNIYADGVGYAPGEVVGRDYRGVLVRSGQARDLNMVAASAEWEIRVASDINDLGWIAATGVSRTTGKEGALLLIPTP